MIFDSIKKYFFNAELIKENKVDLKGATAVGVLINRPSAEDDLTHLKKTIASLHIKDADLFILSYTPQKNIVLQNGELCYSPKEISWAGYPQGEVVNQFIKRPYKEFYYLASTFDNHQRFILHKINASFKAGVHHKGLESYLHLTIDAPIANPAQSFKDLQNLIIKLKTK